MHSETFVRPSVPHPTKRPDEMSLDELRQAAEADALEFYRNKANADPSNEAAREEYKNYCLMQGIDPATGKTSRFASMSLEEIGEEWTAKGQAQEAAELDSWRDRQAKSWLLSRPEYNATPQNADRLIAEMNRLGLKGNPYELDQAFWSCVRQGLIVPRETPPEPVALPNRDECYEMSLDELKKLAEQSNR